MMNIHQSMVFITGFAFVICPSPDFLFYSLPISFICFICITKFPKRMVLASWTIFYPPIRETTSRTKRMFCSSEIRYISFKNFITIFTMLFDFCSWASSSCWAFMVAFHRAVFSYVTFKILESFFAYFARHYHNAIISIGPSPLAIFINVFHNNSIALMYEIDKDYFEAGKRRLENHQKQQVLF